MSALTSALRRRFRWFAPAAPARVSVRDQIGDTLREAIAADANAKANNVQTYEARVDAMIEDFFSKFGERDASSRS